MASLLRCCDQRQDSCGSYRIEAIYGHRCKVEICAVPVVYSYLGKAMAKAVEESQAFLIHWTNSIEGQGHKQFPGRIPVAA